MQKTKYVEVKPSDRLPAEKGEYIVVIDPETNFAGFFSFDPEDPADVEWWKETPDYYLEEKPDYEDEMKEMLERVINAFETDYVVDGEIVDKPYEWLQDVYKETKSLLTKLKTGS